MCANTIMLDRSEMPVEGFNARKRKMLAKKSFNVVGANVSGEKNVFDYDSPDDESSENMHVQQDGRR